MKIKSQNTKNKIKHVGADGPVCTKQERNTKYKIPNTNHGITLVALIITIIVLLILAIVSIRLVMNDGIIGKAEYGRGQYQDGEVRERIALAYKEYEMSQFDNQPISFQQALTNAGLEGATVSEDGKTVTYNGKEYPVSASGDIGKGEKIKTVADYPDATPGTATTENSKYTSNGKTAVIPAGYTVDATQNSIDNGLVISKDGNEWVWIPVSASDLAAMYTEDSTGWTLCGTSGGNAVVTKYKSNSRTDVKSDLTRGNPGDTSSFREPDTVVGNGTQCDNVQANWSAAGFTSFSNMATSLRDDYKNMLDSVGKNGGFYVGRYEISSAGTKKNQQSLTDTNWYNLYAACKASTLGSSSVETRMIRGCQWDQVCKFISTSGDQVSLTDSTSYGNYYNSRLSGHGSKQVTGYSECWKANNIYDIAGNCWEWTQEAYGTSVRAYRGGVYNEDGDGATVAYRDIDSPTSIYSVFSSRPVLYLK